MPHLLTPELIAQLEGVTLEQVRGCEVLGCLFDFVCVSCLANIDRGTLQMKKDWHAARGTSALRGVFFNKGQNAWRAQAKDPATGKGKHLLSMEAAETDAKVLCGKAHDRQVLKWYGR